MKKLNLMFCGMILFLGLSATAQAATPVGYLDSINPNGVASGWTFDPDASSQSIQVHIYIDLPPGTNGSFAGYAGQITASGSRPDVNQAYGISGSHGFQFVIPEKFRDGQSHTLYAYGIDVTGDGNPVLSSPTSFSLVSHLRYFGYFASASTYDGFNTAIGGYNDDHNDYTLEIADHSNVTWIVRGNVSAKLQRAVGLGLRAVIDVSEQFFTDPDPVSGKRTLKASSVWDNFAPSIQGNIQSVAAFYPLDEPYLNGASQQDLETAISAIKQKFPQTPVAVIFDANTVRGDYGPFIIPSGYDWVGFDCYGSFEDCDGQGHNVPWYVDKVKAKLNSTQRLIMVSPGFSNSSNPTSQGDIIIRDNKDLDLAQSDSTFVGIFPFLFQSFPESGNTKVGTRDLPSVRENFRQIGSSIANYNNHKALNPIDYAQFFARQQYLDIQSREPEQGGLDYQTAQITSCGADAGCISLQRNVIPLHFFDSDEFKQANPALVNPGTTTYNQEFVQQCYLRFLKRPADPGGYNYWLSRLRVTSDPNEYNSDRLTVIFGFINSLEYRGRFGQP